MRNKRIKIYLGIVHSELNTKTSFDLVLSNEAQEKNTPTILYVGDRT